MEIRVEIGNDGKVSVLAISACEDLRHDYDYFVKRAKSFAQNNSKTFFLHKRYLRAAVLMLFAYAEAVVNNWLYHSLVRLGRGFEFDERQWMPLVAKIKFLDKAAIRNSRSKLRNAKELRNLIVHLTPRHDAEFFDGLTLSDLKNAEQELLRWFRKMEPRLRMERHAKSAKIARKLSRSLGKVTADVSSKTNG